MSELISRALFDRVGFGTGRAQLSPRKIFCRIKNLPEMVRLLAAATGARTAGRAALTAIWEARREAKTREEAIVMVV